ncbi:TPA: hypothetical protein ACXJE6_008267, partial [Burkholderia contaminans]
KTDGLNHLSSGQAFSLHGPWPASRGGDGKRFPNLGIERRDVNELSRRTGREKPGGWEDGSEGGKRNVAEITGISSC